MKRSRPFGVVTEVKTASSATYAIEYDSNTQILEVTMNYGPPRHHGEVLRYANVPNEVFQAFLQAESKGKLFNANIRSSFPLIT